MPVGSSSGRGHLGSQDAYEFEQFGADPSVVGLARPRGWRVGLPDASQAWDKTGPLDTDWTPVGGGGGGLTGVGINQFRAQPFGTYEQLLHEATFGTVAFISQSIAAGWDVSAIQVYGVDLLNGNDANRGYGLSAAYASAPDYAQACQAAGGEAKQTLKGLASVFPRVGAGRTAEIVIAAGTYPEELSSVLCGVTGYRSIIIRGTVTDPTAGCVAFDGSVADVTMSGGITVTGGNGPGYNFAAGTRREISLTKVGGGDPGFLADKTFGGICPFGWRLRFDANTTTAALRNKCFQICRVTGTDTVKFGRTLPVVPSITDTCYVEMAGVITGNPGDDAVWSNGPCGQFGVQVSGVQSNLQWDICNTQVSLVFCGIEALRAGGENGRDENNAGPWLHSGFTLHHSILGTLTIGGGMRVQTSADLSYGAYNLYGFIADDEITISDPTELTFADGCSAYNIDVTASLGNPNNSSFITPNIGTSYNPASPFTDNDPTPPRVYGSNVSDASIRLRGGSGSLGRLTIEKAAAGGASQSGIAFFDLAKWVITAPIDGTAGNTGAGLNFAGAAGAQVAIQAIPTMTGALGDILLAGMQIATYAHLQGEEIYDTGGNHIFRSTIELGAFYGHTVDPSVMTGVAIGVPIPEHALVRITAAGLVELVKADTAANSSGFVGVAVTAAIAGDAVLVAGVAGFKIVNFDAGAPTPGLLAYVSPVTAGTATVTAPAPGEVTIPIGTVVAAVSGSLGVVGLRPS